jgi:hypothetical protein
MLRLSRSLAAVALLGLLGSCGKGNLSGSVGQFFSLDNNREEILRDDDAFQVTFYRDTATQIDVVARITVVTTGFDFQPGHTFDLSGEYAPGHPRAVVTHAAGGEPSRALPAIKHGALSLDSGGQPGQRTTGTFNVSFEEQGGDFGQGTNLDASFDATTRDASPSAQGADGGS